MVLAERNTTDVVRNGRRSRGPSPNTHATGPGGGTAIVNNAGGGAGAGGAAAGVLGVNSTNASNNEKASNATATGPGAGTPESSDDDNSTKRNGKSKAKQSEYEEKIRVGRDYQAVCPPLIPEPERRPEMMNERALLVWSPTKEIPDLKLEEYISVAKEKYGYNGEQALGMLFWHKHDLERAVMDLANFTPFPDEWTIEDKVLFEQAFQFHGKSFHRIRQMLPDKSIASLVKYYYSWKKTRHRSSAMDRQEKAIKMAVKEGSENGSEVGSNEESDNDDKIQKNRQVIEQQKKDCDAINIDAAIEMVKTNAEAPPPRVSARWTPEETQMATSALRDYGKNYAIIARLVATKNEAHVRTFYLNNRRRLNLDNIVKEYEAMVASKSEEAAAEESTDAAAASATAAAAADATDTASVVGAAATAKLAPTENSDNSSSPSNSNGSVTQDNQTKKEEPAAAALNTAKKKSDTAALAPTAASTIKSTENAAIAATNTLNSTKLGVPTVGTAANSAAIGNSIAINNSSNTATATKGGSNNKSTIMIGDESDTATNSSSDVATNNTAATGTSSASSASVPAKSSGSNPSERDSEASTIKPSSGTASNKREATEMPEDEQTPAKKISLSNPTETLGK